MPRPLSYATSGPPPGPDTGVAGMIVGVWLFAVAAAFEVYQWVNGGWPTGCPWIVMAAGAGLAIIGFWRRQQARRR